MFITVITQLELQKQQLMDWKITEKLQLDVHHSKHSPPPRIDAIHRTLARQPEVSHGCPHTLP